MKKLFSSLAEKAATAMKTNYEIGYGGTTAQVAAAVQDMELAKGALKGFTEGRPENFQTVLANPILTQKGFPKYGELSLSDLCYAEKPAFAALSAEQIQTMTAKMPEAQGQEFLIRLIDVNFGYIANNSPFFAVAAGLINRDFADKIELDRLLAHACNSGSTAAVTVLLNKGVLLEDALFEARINGWNDYAKKVQIYQERLTGKSSDKTQALLIELKQQIQDLTVKVDRLSPIAVPPAAKAPSAEPK
jgi:hypothetical protein